MPAASADAASTPPRPFVVGLTGGIASGKSTVAERFAARGVTVLDADQVARDVVEPGQPALDEVIHAFGPGILGPDGRLDRRTLRQIVFADPERRRRLEAILHPAIRAAMASRAAAAPGPYQIHMIPLLVEGRGRDGLDRVLVVDCPAEVQLQRLMTRDAESAAQARSIIAAQADRDTRLRAADDVIRNDGPPEALDRQVEVLHRLYLSLARSDR